MPGRGSEGRGHSTYHRILPPKNVAQALALLRPHLDGLPLAVALSQLPLYSKRTNHFLEGDPLEDFQAEGDLLLEKVSRGYPQPTLLRVEWECPALKGAVLPLPAPTFISQLKVITELTK